MRLRLGKVAVLVGIAETLNGIYDSYCERKRKREDDEKDRKIRELEAELAKLKEESK